MNQLKYILIITFSFVSPAMAYIDPGSGSIIISAIIGFIVTIGVSIKAYWYKLKSVFSRKHDKEESEISESKD